MGCVMTKALISKLNIRSIKWKLTLIFLLVISLTVIMFEGIFMFGLKKYYYSNIEQVLKDRLNLNIEVYEKYLGYSTLDHKIKYIIENASIPNYIEIQILDLNGYIIESSSQFYSKNKVNTSDVLASLQGNEGSFIGKNIDTNEPVMAVSKPVYENEDIVGVIRYITSVAEVQKNIDKFSLYAALVGVLILLISFQIGNWFSSKLISPIYRLKAGTDKIAQGELDVHVQKFENDEIGELIDTFNYMVEEIKKTEKLKNEFISSISHELRTPLTSIRGWSETILDSAGDIDEETDMALGIISKESQRLSTLVDNLLDFAKLNVNAIILYPVDINMNHFIKMIISQLQILLNQNEIEHEEVFESKDIIYKGDADRLKQVFINVYDNAIKYSARRSIKTRVYEDENWVYVEIKDTGDGIVKEDVENVTNKFYKGKHSKSGSGLGLSITKKILELHASTIQISSEYQEGTTVLIKLFKKYTLLEDL